VFTHLRESWQSPAQPVTGPPIDWRTIDTFVVHYSAAARNPDGSIPSAVATKLRTSQADYIANRGYSLGYSASVDQSGASWEIRGNSIRTAANVNHNGHTFTVLCLVNAADPATDAAAAEVRRLVAAASQLAGRQLAVVGHGALSGAATACPGAGLRQQLAAGVFDPFQPPTPTEDEMTYHVTYVGPATPGASRPELLLVQGRLVGFASPAERDACVKATGAKPWPIASPQQYDEVVRAYRT
jgi:hypothetical protein